MSVGGDGSDFKTSRCCGCEFGGEVVRACIVAGCGTVRVTRLQALLTRLTIVYNKGFSTLR